MGRRGRGVVSVPAGPMPFESRWGPAVVAVISLSCCCLLSTPLFLDGGVLKADRDVLLQRADSTREALGMPTSDSAWGSALAQARLTDNIGAGNLQLNKLIKSLKAARTQPNFAAAVHSLETSTSESQQELADKPLPMFGERPAAPVFSDPQGFVHRLQNLRKGSRYCRLHPQSCTDLAPEWQPAPAHREEDKSGAEEQLAQLGTRTYSGKGDSLLPHGQLWGLKGNAVRYHEYPGFYKGSQADRAATESPKQAASEAYGLETKMLDDAWKNRARIIKSFKSKGFRKDYKEGKAMFAVAASKAGKVLPKMKQLEKSLKGKKLRKVNLPSMQGLSMSVTDTVKPSMALGVEQQYQSRQQAVLSRLADQLKAETTV